MESPAIKVSKPCDPATPTKATDTEDDVLGSERPTTAASLRKGTQESEVLNSRGTEVTALSRFTPHDDDQPSSANQLLDFSSLPPPIAVVDSPIYILEPLDDLPAEANISDQDEKLLHTALHTDPFSLLGPRVIKTAKHSSVLLIRAWVKDSIEVAVAALPKTAFTFGSDNKPAPMIKKCEWLHQKCFVAKDAKTQKPVELTFDIISKSFFYDYTVSYADPSISPLIRDPYSFGLLASEYDLQLFQSGSCWHVDSLMGSHMMTIDGAKGVRFLVWAPHAIMVSVVGDWNRWDGRAHPMRHRHSFGCWELFIPALVGGMKYGYRIHSRAKQDFIKIDPYAQEFENPPATASVITACDDAYKKPADRFKWTDDQWMKQRMDDAKDDWVRRRPMAIYEVHLPSWMRGEGNTYLGYREMADRLVSYAKKLNFTHVEFLPLAHHPFEGSWGYQVSGQFAPYSRLGCADDLKYLINKLHENDIGVFIDFVPAHFCKDAWGLVYFDGEPCYEYADPREGEHKEWGTMVFNFRRNEVRSFLLGAAYHWLRCYHVDGLRIDAVSSMLYKNYLRPAGEWIPNEVGGDANLQAISLLQELNWVVHKEFPGIFTMAEESTSWKGVTAPPGKGLGFDAKWDLGWMNDTLSYLCNPTSDRPSKHSKLTFRGLYLGHEKWVLPLSHDEVVSGKGSLLDKCGFIGSPFVDRLKTLRALFGYQVGMPGRPLIFMGSEFGQGREWKESRSIDWHEAEEESRSKSLIWMSDLLAVYRYHKALHAGDDESWNFKWVDCDNANDCILAWLRSYEDWFNDVLVICNFSGETYKRYPVGVSHGGEWEVLLNSDDWRYSGSMVGPGNLTKVHTTQGGRLGWPYCLWLDLPPFSCMFFKAPQPTPQQILEAEKEHKAAAAAEKLAKIEEVKTKAAHTK